VSAAPKFESVAIDAGRSALGTRIHDKDTNGASPAKTGILHPSWIVRLLRIGCLVAGVGQAVDIAQYVHSPALRVQMPLDLLVIAASILAIVSTFRRGFINHWKPVAAGFCVLLVTIWTCNCVIVGQQVELFVAIIVLLMVTCGLVPWESHWQVPLTGYCLLAAVINVILVRPSSPQLPVLWIDLLAASVAGLVSNRLWAQWRLALVTANQSALAASHAKTEFLSSMSHEIRTPMTAILGMADLLGETELDQEQRRFLDVMTNNGNSLLRLINDVLDLAKIESGRLTLEAVAFDLDELMNTVGEALAVRAHEKGLELAMHLPPGVPTHLLGDPLRIRQILINLVGNAIKFTERGSVITSVALEPGDAEQVRLHFSVADTGIGISPELVETIFSDFTQADASTTRQYGGTGLGLAIVKRLVTMMAGRIWVESQLGQGSTFHFTARLAPIKGDGVIKLDRPLAEVDLHAVRTLVVDDTPVNRLILREMLSAAGAEVSEAGGARAALAEIEHAALNGRPYTLMVLDYRMPDIDGIELMGMLRAKKLAHQMVVVMLTSDDLKLQLLRAHEAGLDAYLVKPIKRAELLSAVKMALGTAQARRKTAAAPPSRPVAAAPVGDSRMIRVLLAEDSRDNTMLIELFLRNTRFLLDTAENGEVAVAKFRAGGYDAVLMDINMPVMDGYAALREIRKWEREQKLRETPVIALTASAFREDAQRALAAGFQMHVPKPIKKATLTDALTEVTGSATGRGSTPDADPAYLESTLR